MVTTEVLLKASEEEVDRVTGMSTEEKRQHVNREGLHTLHWTPKLQQSHQVDEKGAEVRA